MSFNLSEVDNFFRGVGETVNVNQFELADDFESAWKDGFGITSEDEKTPEVIMDSLAREVVQLRKKVAELSKEASEAQETIMKYDILGLAPMHPKNRSIMEIISKDSKPFRFGIDNFIIAYQYKLGEWNVVKHTNVGQSLYYHRNERTAQNVAKLLNKEYPKGWAT